MFFQTNFVLLVSEPFILEMKINLFFVLINNIYNINKYGITTNAVVKLGKVFIEAASLQRMNSFQSTFSRINTHSKSITNM